MQGNLNFSEGEEFTGPLTIYPGQEEAYSRAFAHILAVHAKLAFQ